jgi:hypothetical protein
MKKFYITSAFIALIIIGFIIPNLARYDGLEPELYADLRQVIGNGIFFMTEKIIPNKDNQYPNHCKGSEQVLIQIYGWMMIPKSVIEACVVRNEQGEITGMKSIGMIKKGK